MGKSVITVVICFVLISSFINAIPQTEAICIYAECNFIFNVNNESLDIDVSPGGDNELNILCLEKCDFLKNDMISKLDISIQATSEQGWIIGVDPSEFTLTPKHDSQYIYINISVPFRTSFYITDTIQITGKATTYPGGITDILDPMTCTLRVNQYYSAVVKTTNTARKIKTGQEATYNISITNTGNARDTFQIIVNNLNKLENVGLDVKLPGKIIIDANQTKFVHLTFRTSDWTKPGNYNIELSVRSIQEEQNEGYTIPHNMTLNLEVEPDYYLFLGVGAVIIVILVGILVFTLKKRRIMI